MAWLMLYLITNSSASIEVMLTTWYIIFLIGFKSKWMHAINVVILFLIPVSETMTIDLESNKILRTYSLSL